MSTIEFICPHCSHKMELPASLIGKNGSCPSCKASVIVTNSNDFNLESETTVTTESLSVPAAKSDSPTQTPEPVTSTGTDAIRERITRLQIAKQRFEEADSVRVKAMQALEDAKSAVSSVCDPIGSSVVLAFTLGEINDSPLFADLLEANRKLQQFQNDLLALESGPNANLIQKTKAKTQQLIVQQKIKQGEKLINSEQYKLGKKIVDSKIYDSFICSTTKHAFEKLNTLQSNIVEAENNLKVANSSLGELNNELMSSVPLNNIEGVQTFDIAIGVSERQLAEIKGVVATEIDASHPASVNLSNRSVEAQQTGVRTKRQKNNKFGKKVVIALTSVVFVGGIGFALYSFLSEGRSRSTIMRNEPSNEPSNTEKIANEDVSRIKQLVRDFDAGLITRTWAADKLADMKEEVDNRLGLNRSAVTPILSMAAKHVVTPKPDVLDDKELIAIADALKHYRKIKVELSNISSLNTDNFYEKLIPALLLEQEFHLLPTIPLQQGGPDFVQKWELREQLWDITNSLDIPYEELNDEEQDVNQSLMFLATGANEHLAKFRHIDSDSFLINSRLRWLRERLDNLEGAEDAELVSTLKKYCDEWQKEVDRSAN